MKKTETLYQSWRGDSPIFFRNGRRINLENGYNLAIRFGLIKDGNLLHQWFKQHCKIIACDSPFLIANDLDAPKALMVTQCSQYIHRYYVGWGKVGIDSYSTNVTDFGIDISKNADGTYQFTKSRDSIAKYKDGVNRQWQGSSSFVLHPWYFVEKIKGGAA